MQFNKSGFTLVELVLVLVIIGLLSAVAIPKYIEVNTEQESAEKNQLSGFVKSALVVAQADINSPPSVNTLASYVQGNQVQVIGSGIVLQHEGETYMVPTYVDNNCSNPTNTSSDVVKCVGDIQ
ncbi:MAG: prepilin-type N-terminal cleavage/methylation domain-containing protein [Gammaproteobacteria bacterium]|jgi:prepilin-type N-terminal cleavage/methylation domain-containing protein